MAKTASLNATSRPGVRCTEGGSCPALPPGARAVVNECTQRVTEAAHAMLAGGGIRTDGSHWCGLPRAVTRQLPEVPDSVGPSVANPGRRRPAGGPVQGPRATPTWTRPLDTGPSGVPSAIVVGIGPMGTSIGGMHAWFVRDLGRGAVLLRQRLGADAL